MSTKRILIIENDESDQKLITRYLKEIVGDVEFIIANTGKEGIDKASSNTIDLVVLENYLPKMTGYEICHEIKKSKPDLKVIFLTGAELSIRGIDTINSGVDLVLSKICMKDSLKKAWKILNL